MNVPTGPLSPDELALLRERTWVPRSLVPRLLTTIAERTAERDEARELLSKRGVGEAPHLARLMGWGDLVANLQAALDSIARRGLDGWWPFQVGDTFWWQDIEDERDAEPMSSGEAAVYARAMRPEEEG